MRRFSLALSLLCLTAIPAEAAEVEYFGGLVITGQSGDCPGGDYVGTRYVTRYRPAGVGDNGPNSDLNVFDPRGNARGHRLDGRNFDTQFRRVVATVVSGGSGLVDTPVRIRFLTESRNPDFVRVDGEIKGFDFQPQCTHTFLYAGVRRPL